jgi:hypothetical protein
MISPDPDEFVRQLASEITASPEEAAAAVEEMQKDIGRCAEAEGTDNPFESRILKAIAWRRLFKVLR